MTRKIESRLKTLGVELPEPSKPGANYVPFHISGNLLFLQDSCATGMAKGFLSANLGKILILMKVRKLQGFVA